MNDPTWVDIWKAGVESLAVLVGGGWAVFRFGLAREHVAYLALTLHYECHDNGDGSVTAIITVRLENKGKSKLSAKPRRVQQGEQPPAYSDERDVLSNPCGIQFRLVPPNPSIGHLSWYKLKDSSSISEVNLLEEMEEEGSNEVDFHLEPSEVVEVTAPMVLPKGTYVAKVHFVGAGGRMDFWSKLFWIKADGGQVDTGAVAL